MMYGFDPIEIHLLLDGRSVLVHVVRQVGDDITGVKCDVYISMIACNSKKGKPELDFNPYTPQDYVLMGSYSHLVKKHIAGLTFQQNVDINPENLVKIFDQLKTKMRDGDIRFIHSVV